MASTQGCLLIPAVWLVTRLCRSLPPVAVVWMWRLALLKVLAALLMPIPIHVAGESAGTYSSQAALLPATWICVLSAVMAALIIAELCVQMIALHRLVRKSIPDVEMTRVAEELASDLKVRQSIRMLYSDLADRPMLVKTPKVRGYSIVLPSAMTSETIEIQRMVIAHELAHVRYADLLWNWVLFLPQAALHFHPLVRLALYELRQAQESACDERARRVTGTSAREYGRMLLQVALRRTSTAMPLGAASVSTDYKSLRSRLRRLDDREPRSVLLAAALISACFLFLPAWRVVEMRKPAVSRAAVAGPLPWEGYGLATGVSPASKLGSRMAAPRTHKEGS
jgi:beta-lactamase regulating signal transducer with metallopeptidase domain